MFLVTDIKKILFVLAFAIGLFSNAQVDSTKYNSQKHRTVRKSGDNCFKKGDYFGATSYYKKFLSNSDSLYSGDNVGMPLRRAFLYVKYEYKLAQAYRLSRDYYNAEKLYSKVFEAKPKKYPKSQFHLAQMQLMNGKYNKAKENFLQFKKSFKEDSNVAKMIKKHIKLYLATCEAAPNILKDTLNIKVHHPDTSINKAHVELSPVPLNDSILLYSSLRSDTIVYVNEEDTLAKVPNRKFYTAIKKNDSTWVMQGEYADGWFNLKDSENGNGCYNSDSSQFYFSRGVRNLKGQLVFHLYYSNREDGGSWSEPVKMNKEINLKGFHSTHPAMGKVIKNDTDVPVLYFVSNRVEKARGGWDIWYTQYNPKKEVWKTPKNAGAKINTALDEMSPSYNPNTKTMHFSSQGWPGIGGFDVFKTTGELREWSNPENVGYPINTSVDELYFVKEKGGDAGYFVSNRVGSVSLKNPTCCDDIFYYKENDFLFIAIKGRMFEISESKKDLDTVPTSQFALTLFLIDDSLAGGEMMINSLFPEDDGSYFIPLEKGKDYSLRSNSENYFSIKHDFSTKGITESDTIVKNLYMKRFSERPIIVKDIYYEFDKYNLLDSSKTVIDTTVYKILTDNESIIIEIGSHTDSRGTDLYNETLSQNRAQSVVDYLVSKGIDKKRIKAKGYGEREPIAPNQNPDGTDNPEGRQMNRRTEFRVVGKIEGVSKIIYLR